MKVTLDSKTILFAGASALALSSFAPAAIAQEDQDEGRRTLSTVTVTATQRAESIQDVPIAITALDPEALDRAGVADITRLDQVAPSFNMNTSDTQSGGVTLRLRGVGTTGNNIGLESSVGVFIDGVYQSRPGLALGDLLDLEQIEVLRGPQGTLFGRNTSAGALNVKTKAPTLNEQEGFMNATVGNLNLINVQAGANIPLIEDKLAIRVSGAVRERDGYVKSVVDGSESYKLDRLVLRGQALADFGEGGTLRLIVDYNEADDQCCDAVWANDTSRAAAFAAPVGFLSGIPSGRIDAFGGAPAIIGPELDNYFSNGSNFSETIESIGFSAEYNVSTALGELTYIGSYKDFEANAFRNTDFSYADVFTVGVSPEAQLLTNGSFFPGGSDIETMTHEIRLQGNAFDDRLDWLVGAYYSDEDILAAGSLTMLGEAQEYMELGILGGALGPVFTALAGGASTNGDFAANTFTQSGESFSIFTHNVLSVTDRLDLTVGLRFVDESKDGKFEQSGGQFNACDSFFNTMSVLESDANLGNIITLYELATVVNCFVFAAPAIDPNNLTGGYLGASLNSNAGLLAFLPQEFDDTFEDDELVYTLNASYAVNDTTRVYAGFTHGFKSGGFNLDASAAAGGSDPRFASEKIDAWEIGLKSDFWDGRARANVAVFFQEMEDFQVLEFTGTQFQTFNVGKAESSGFEFEGQAQLTDNLGVSLGVTYADAKYPDDCTPMDPSAPGFARNPLTLCGQPLTNAPEWVTILGAIYERPVFDNRLDFFMAGSVRNETERRTSSQPVEAITSLQLANGNGMQPGLTGPADTVAEVMTLIASAPALPHDIQEENTKVNLRLGLSSPDERWTIELWGNNIFDERTKNVTFNIPLRGGFGDRARGQFVQEPATYGVTLRTQF